MLPLDHIRHQTLPNSNRTFNSTHLSLHSKPTHKTPIPKDNTPNCKIPILEYINIMKKKTNTNWNKENLNLVKLPKPSLAKSKSRISHEAKLRMSQIVSRRRHVKINDQHIDSDLYKKHKLGQIVDSILGCYEYYRKFEYSDSKITSIVKHHCKEKKDLEWILLRKIKSELNPSQFSIQYRRSHDDITGRLLRTIICKLDHYKNLLIRDLVNFKSSLEEDLIDKGTCRIQTIKQSINNGKKELSYKISEIEQNYSKVRRQKTFHRSLPEQQIEKIMEIDQYAHTIQQSSRINRLLYKHFNAALRQT